MQEIIGSRVIHIGALTSRMGFGVEWSNYDYIKGPPGLRSLVD